ncbi:hypothetical protein OBBRIDRAFT_552175 [Obba rivulosa]|uniref:Uncharacterized protein n=1 Tax=Obba rivulosa TaxID=1052685 RepID=A0A8E2DMJ1_9APHY|nr:hypothetical protein OBBRIDRAFT_552175 [Obba rivulosa]
MRGLSECERTQDQVTDGQKWLPNFVPSAGMTSYPTHSPHQTASRRSYYRRHHLPLAQRAHQPSSSVAHSAHCPHQPRTRAKAHTSLTATTRGTLLGRTTIHLPRGRGRRAQQTSRFHCKGILVAGVAAAALYEKCASPVCRSRACWTGEPARSNQSVAGRLHSPREPSGNWSASCPRLQRGNIQCSGSYMSCTVIGTTNAVESTMAPISLPLYILAFLTKRVRRGARYRTYLEIRLKNERLGFTVLPWR